MVTAMPQIQKQPYIQKQPQPPPEIQGGFDLSPKSEGWNNS